MRICLKIHMYNIIYIYIYLCYGHFLSIIVVTIYVVLDNKLMLKLTQISLKKGFTNDSIIIIYILSRVMKTNII